MELKRINPVANAPIDAPKVLKNIKYLLIPYI